MSNDPMVELIGVGGQGNCYLLKQYKPPYVMKENPRNALDELKVLKKLVHPNIVRYLDQPSDYHYNGECYPIFMEYCEEGDLRKAIHDETLNYSMATVVNWTKELFTALTYLHSKGIAHRDVKPKNIFLAKNFVLKLGDFGIVTQENEKKLGRIGGGSWGTELYQPPEFAKKEILRLEDLYQGDVFAAGLTVFELMERSQFTSKGQRLLFTPSKWKAVENLQELIRCCSCITVSEENRKNTKDVLLELNALEKLFKQLIVLPERKHGQQRLSKPAGHCYESYTVPPVIFNLAEMENTTKIDQNDSSQLTICHKLQLVLDEFLSKINEKTDFLHLTQKRIRFNTNGENVNEMRETFCGKLIESLSFDSLSTKEKEILCENIQAFEMKFAREFHGEISAGEASDRFSQTELDFDNLEFVADPESRLNEPFLSFQNVLRLDYSLQDRCIPFAIHTLWNCDSLSLSWVELMDLLCTAIQNIEQVESVFSRRRLFFFTYLGESRNQWCSGYDLFFKKDLSDLGVYSKWKKRTYRLKYLGETPIDLELIRRALYDRLETVEVYARFEMKSREEVAKELDTFFNVYNMFRLNRLGPISYLPVDFVQCLPLSAKDLVERTFDAEKTKFPGYIFLLDTIPESIISPRCSCETPCQVATFPEIPMMKSQNAELLTMKSLQLSYSTCPKQQQKDFLETHSLFERAFRLLHCWYDVKLQQTTHFYLLEKIINEMKGKSDPSIGFHFLLFTEKNWPVSGEQFVCHTEGKGGNGKRTGLLLGVNHPQPNAFWHKEFYFESISDLCLLEYVGLVYISLFELQKLLKLMYQYLSNSGIGCNEDEGVRRREKYRRTMQKSFEKFWEKRKVYT